MTWRASIIVLIANCWLHSTTSTLMATEALSERPNIVVILADDFGVGDIRRNRMS